MWHRADGFQWNFISLFLLKVLCVAMASRWKKYQDENRAQPPGSSHSSDPPPLNENCARYILSVMILYLRQTAPSEQRLLHKTSFAVDSSFREYESLDLSSAAALDASIDEKVLGFQLPDLPSLPSAAATVNPSVVPIPPSTWVYEPSHASQVKSPSSMNTLIGKFTGRIVYHLSASNWAVVMFRLRTKIHYLAQTAEEKPDIVDMGLMTHSALDRIKLIQVLNGAEF
jgi:hypothetical protein